MPVTVLLLSLISCLTPSSFAENETLTNYDHARIQQLRNDIRAEERYTRKPYAKLLRYADSLLTVPLYDVTQKTIVPPSGDKHDYLSLAPYWWPDPKQADGLPWIRRDGEVNPTTKDRNTDDQPNDRAFDNIEGLAWAAYFSGDERYAERAVAQIDRWFLAPNSRMNPNLNYAQGVPGRSEGRCFGVIELLDLQGVITALELLALEDRLPAETKTGMRSWLSDFNDWLLTSDLGREEGNRHNNHGTWYDALTVCLSRYLGDDDRARSILEAVKTKRIAPQIQPDGSQPEELARTKSVSYSAMNLRGFTRLAWHGSQLGVDLWNYETEDGRSIRKAYDYLQPYFFDGKPWTYQQLGDLEERIERSRSLFYRTGAMMGVAEYCALYREHGDSPRSMEDLLFICR